MGTAQEPDFPPGHPARFDYNPESPEAREYMRKHFFPKGERDYPVDNLKACDTPGNDCSLQWHAGVDPLRPELEAFSGRTPAQAKAAADMVQALSAQAKDSPALEPVVAPGPPTPSA